MKTRLLSLTLGLLVLGSSALHAQTWINAGSGAWTNAANWSGATVPNATNATATFTNSGAAITNNLTNSFPTIGTLDILGTRAVVLGDVADSTDFLNLATSSGTPTINVAVGTNNLFIYAQLDGTNGFTKTGLGTMSFRFNDLGTHIYSGNVNLAAGTLALQNDNSLGVVGNDVFFTGDATLLSAAAAGGNISLGFGRNLTANPGVTARLANNQLTNQLTVNGNLEGSGNFQFNGLAGATNEATTSKYFINGSNSYTGQTIIQSGSSVTLGSGSKLSTNALAFTGGQTNGPTVATLNLGGATQKVSSLTIGTLTNFSRTISVTNGRLDVEVASANLAVEGANGTTLNLGGLSQFLWDGGSSNRIFTLRPNISAGVNSTNTMILAQQGLANNTMTASTLQVGGGVGTSGGTDHLAQMILGQNNAFQANSLTIGGFNARGFIGWTNAVTNGGVKISGISGVTPMGTLVVGETSSGVRRGSGTLQLGRADVSVSNTYVGVFGANAVTNLTVSNQVSMTNGTFTGTSVVLGAITNASVVSSATTNISRFDQTGGTSSITTLRMGDDRTTAGNNVNYVSTYQVSGAGSTLEAQTIDAGTNANFGANSARTLGLDNATLQNKTGSSLSVNGFNSTAAGRMNVVLANTVNISASTNQSVTLGANTLVSGSGILQKTGAGTMQLQSASTYSGLVEIQAGTVALTGAGALDNVVNIQNNGTLDVTGKTGGSLTIGPSQTVTGAGTFRGNFVLQGTLQPGNSPGLQIYDGNLTMESSALTFMEITGTGRGTEFDALNITGALTYGGDLALNFSSTFNIGDSFNLFSFGSQSGNFSSIFLSGSYTGNLTNNSGTWNGTSGGTDLSFNQATGTLSVVPEPSTYTLLALAGVGAWAWRLRRRQSPKA
jgi:autotransporter-associated beta strand protein